ncbi:MAG TPA: MBL fold metallo-hydrolase [Actinomycetota bacterium]|jgi:glyoxylase-like metal-dependent hydrolase (beta-lactamase superfamily II)|nr:MBL fold metallo-hydrolase [Micrococcales bacterium]HPE11883.1 MBL fold metallo-hydrolase [Actinomycetota bacterium]HPJ18479.1 MBL fold metallo-hydrolase [Actinomycetota bacterium]
MSYTGKTHVGGPAQVHELTRLTISKLAVGPMDNNCYLLRCRETGEQLLIDAAAEPERILDLIGPDGLTTIVTTHAHPDHWGALAEVRKQTGATSVAHEADAEHLAELVNRTVVDGDTITVGQVALRVIHLVGHTPGSIALLYDDPMGQPHLFTGDCLFPGGVGKTWSPEDFDTLLAGVKERIFDSLPDETWVYPGHGNDTTVGTERPSLTEWEARRW